MAGVSVVLRLILAGLHGSGAPLEASHGACLHVGEAPLEASPQVFSAVEVHVLSIVEPGSGCQFCWRKHRAQQCRQPSSPEVLLPGSEKQPGSYTHKSRSRAASPKVRVRMMKVTATAHREGTCPFTRAGTSAGIMLVRFSM